MSALFISVLLVAASCGEDGTTEAAEPVAETSPAVTSAEIPEFDFTPETLELDEPTVPFCGADIPASGPTVAEIRSGLAEFRAADTDPVAIANNYASYPELPVSDGAVFVGFSTLMTDEGDGELTYGTSLAYRVTQSPEDVISLYETYAAENGWSFESEDVAESTLFIMNLESPDGSEALKVSYSVNGTGKPTNDLTVRLSARGEVGDLGDPSIWHEWHTEELPYVEGACYRGGGASTNIEHPDASTTLGGPGDNITVELAYVDTTVEAFSEAIIANAEAAGFTVEPGRIEGTHVFSKEDYTIEYQVTSSDSINGILATASANYPVS